MINYIWLTWNLACKLRTYKTCNSMIRFSKYKFNKKLLSGVILCNIYNWCLYDIMGYMPQNWANVCLYGVGQHFKR